METPKKCKMHNEEDLTLKNAILVLKVQTSPNKKC